MSALSLVCLSAAPCAAGDDVRFFGRVFPRAGSPAFRAHAARLAALRLESARGGPSKLPSVERSGRPALMGWVGNGVPVTAPPTPQVTPTAAADGSGGAVIAWADYRTPTGEIYAIRLTSDGDPAAGWPAGGLAATASDSMEIRPVAVSDGAGGAFIGFGILSGASAYGTIYVQRVAGTGTVAPGWPANGVALVPPGAPVLGRRP